MSVRDAVRRQYERIVDTVAARVSGTSVPREGWVRTVRKALGMTGTQLAKRLGVTKAAVYQAERRELDGEVTIKHMQSLANGLGCRFVYAIVPDTSVENAIRVRARKKATAIVGRADVHMALEQQALATSRNREEVERIVEELVRRPPPDLWDDI